MGVGSCPLLSPRSANAEVDGGRTSWLLGDLTITGEINSDGNSRLEICH